MAQRPSPLAPCPSPLSSRPGLGLIELLTLVALLMIGLAFVVSMARHVRSTSANELTRKRMLALAAAVDGLATRGIDATIPLSLSARPGDAAAREAILQAFAVRSSRALGDALSGEGASDGAAALPGRQALAALPTLAGAVPELRDAWGNPIALLPGQQGEVGMAPDDGPFLVSAGPDGRFLTLADNLYSYDLPVSLARVGTTRPAAENAEFRMPNAE